MPLVHCLGYLSICEVPIGQGVEDVVNLPRGICRLPVFEVDRRDEVGSVLIFAALLDSVDRQAQVVSFTRSDLACVIPHLLRHLLPLRHLVKIHLNARPSWCTSCHFFGIFGIPEPRCFLQAFVWLGTLQLRSVLLGTVKVFLHDEAWLKVSRIV